MAEDTTYRKLFVGGLYRTRVTELRNYFLQFGAVTEAFVVNGRHGRSKGFGFVTFNNPEDAATACQNRFHIIDGRTVNCNLAAFPNEIPRRSSRNRAPRMQLGGAAPLPSTNLYGSPNVGGSFGPDPVPMQGAGPIPPVYQYDQTSLRNERGTGNYPKHM